MTEASLPAWTLPDWARSHWPQRILPDYLDNAVACHPNKAAIVDHNSMRGEGTTLSYRQLHRLVGRIAGGLGSMGVEKGSIVACQLPNWWQFVALYLACAFGRDNQSAYANLPATRAALHARFRRSENSGDPTLLPRL